MVSRNRTSQRAIHTTRRCIMQSNYLFAECHLVLLLLLHFLSPQCVASTVSHAVLATKVTKPFSRKGWFALIPRGGEICQDADQDTPSSDLLPESEVELNYKSHGSEVQENLKDNAYFMGTCNNDIMLIETKGYDVGNYTLPDFNNEFRAAHGDNLIHVSRNPMFTSDECDRVVQLAEDHFKSSSADSEAKGWSKLPSGRFEIAGSWIKDIPGVREWFNDALRDRIFPALAGLFPEVVTDPSKLCVQSAYLFKYTPESGEKTDMHMDSSLLSFTILLNDPSEFEGGGTFFEALGDEGEVIFMNKGDITLRPAGLRHRGHPITRGERYVIGGFVTVAGNEGCEHTRQLLTRGTVALFNGETDCAKRLFELAKNRCPDFSETYMSYAHCLRKRGDYRGALEGYLTAFRANPRNADSGFMVGVMHGELGDDDEALRWYQRASYLNEYDGDAWYRQGLVMGRKGNKEAEQSFYEKALEVQPNHVDALCNLGVIYGEAGNVDREIECYTKALSIEPTHEDALNNAKAALYYEGVKMFQNGNLDKSLHCFKRILDDIAPGEPSVEAAYQTVLNAKGTAVSQQNDE